MALIASRDLADESSYYGDDDQTNTKPSQSAFTGTGDDGTSAARHGIPPVAYRHRTLAACPLNPQGARTLTHQRLTGQHRLCAIESWRSIGRGNRSAASITAITAMPICTFGGPNRNTHRKSPSE